MRRHTAPRGYIIERKNGVRSPTRFERTNLLEVLALKKERGAVCLIQPRASQDWRAMNVWSNPFVSRTDAIKFEPHG